MTFSQISYLRVDIETLSRQVEEYTAKLNNACSAEEAAAYIKNCSLLLSDQLTMETVSYIRYTMNTEDTFYSAEQEYYAEETPALMEKLKSFQRAMLDSRFRPQLERIFAPVLFLNAEIADKTLSAEVLPPAYPGKQTGAGVSGAFRRDAGRDGRESSCRLQGLPHLSLAGTEMYGRRHIRLRELLL